MKAVDEIMNSSEFVVPVVKSLINQSFNKTRKEFNTRKKKRDSERKNALKAFKKYSEAVKMKKPPKDSKPKNLLGYYT
jgi:hypothetical protein